MVITWLDPQNNDLFPPVDQAFDDGLLAAGGDLSSTRLINAYRQGIFPWFNKQDPILWWSPDPRLILWTDQIKLSKSLKKTIRTTAMTISFDQAFNQVITACSQPRQQGLDPDNSTWIHPDMIAAYNALHEQGHAHSVECWLDGQLVGGLYGIAIGQAFFGESMFSRVTDSSKLALVALCQQLQRWKFPLIDCQIYSGHLASLGAQEISRSYFIEQLDKLCGKGFPLNNSGPWQIDPDLPTIL
jgi:leucyl/phenylalanyl-tRNA---protein transferase